VPVLIVDETHISPEDDVESRLLALVGAAASSVRLNIYGFSYVPLIDLLIQKHQAGVLVIVVCDHTQAEGTYEKPQLQRLVDAGIEVVITTSPTGAIDHEKVVLTDTEVPAALTGFGSYNFTASAEKERNTFSVRSDAALIAQFLANWQASYEYGKAHHPEWQLTPSGNGPPTPSSS
jgi:hypothetical protein